MEKLEKKNKRKAMYYKAKSMSLSNAAEFIRSHGEEGFRFMDDRLSKEYRKQNHLLANQLDDRALIFERLYDATGFVIDCEVDDDY